MSTPSNRRAASDKTVLIMTVNGISEPGDPVPGTDQAFASGIPFVWRTEPVTYNFNIDSDGDATADVVFRFRFGRADGDGEQRFVITRNWRFVLFGKTTEFDEEEAEVSSRRGVKAFAGRRDDPFFFDLLAFLEVDERAFCDGSQFDFFAGRNVSAIVLEVPNRTLTGGGDSNIAVWATTARRGGQIDRMGRPAINTVLIPTTEKNGFNAGAPADDPAEFTDVWSRR